MRDVIDEISFYLPELSLYREILEKVRARLAVHRFVLWCRSDTDVSNVEWPRHEGEDKRVVRLGVKRTAVAPIDRLYDVLHELGHVEGGIPPGGQDRAETRSREVSAWARGESALLDLGLHGHLGAFRIRRDACLRSYA